MNIRRLRRQEAPNDSGVIEFLDLRAFLRNFRLTYLCCDVYIGGFRISVASCAGCSQAPPRRRGGNSIQYVTRRTAVPRSYIYSPVTT